MKKETLLALMLKLVLIICVGAVMGLMGYALMKKQTRVPEIKIPDEVIEDKIADWQTYRNEEFGFEVRYPEEWEVGEDKLQTKEMREVVVPQKPVGGIRKFSEPTATISWSSQQSNSEHALDFWLKKYCSEEKIEEGFMKVIGHGSYRATHCRSKDILCEFGYCYSYYNSFIQVPNQTSNLEIQLKVGEEFSSERKAENFKEYFPIFDQILSTFKFIEKNETADWQIYQSEKGGFELSAPAKWGFYERISSAANGVNLFLFFDEEAATSINEYDYVQLNIRIKQNKLNLSMEDFYNGDKHTDLFSDARSGYDEIVVGGKSAIRFKEKDDIGTDVVVIPLQDKFVEIDSANSDIEMFNKILLTFKFIENETADENKPSIYSSKGGENFLLLNGEKTGFSAYEFEKENLILFQEIVYDEEKSQNHYSLKTVSTVSPYEIKTLIDNKHISCTNNGGFLGEKNNVYFFETEVGAPGHLYELFLFNPVSMDFVLITDFYGYYDGPHSISLYSSISKVPFNIKKQSRISVRTREMLLPNDNDIEIIFNEKSFTKKEVDQGKADYIKDIFNYNFAMNAYEINNKKSNDRVDVYLKYFPDKFPCFINREFNEITGYFDLIENKFVPALDL